MRRLAGNRRARHPLLTQGAFARRVSSRLATSRREAVRSAFTLIEVILAITLVLAMVVSLFAFYSNAIEIRRDVTDGAHLLMAERSVMDGLTNELRTAIVYAPLNLGVSGNNYEIRFACTAIPGPAVWAERDPTAEPVVPEHDVQVLTYRLRVDSNFDPVMILGLERCCQRLLTPLVPNQGTQVRLVTPQFLFLSFRYFDGAAWQDSWPSGGSDAAAAATGQTSLLPMGVEVILGTKPIPDGMTVDDYLVEYATSVYRREIFVPAGLKPLSGTVVRGAGGSTP